MALIPQEVRIFSRVRLDRETTDLDPDDLQYAMNVDLFLENGTIRTRRGRSHLYPSALSTQIRLLAKVNGTRYQVAGRTLYRDGVALESLVPSDTAITFAWEADETTEDTRQWTTAYGSRVVTFSWEKTYAVASADGVLVTTHTWEPSYFGEEDVTNLLELSALETTAIQASRPLNDTTTWAFIADPDGMYKDDGTNLRAWGLTAPAAKATLGTAGTGLTGNYYVQYTYVRKVGDAVIAESNPSPLSDIKALSNQSLTVSVVASTDAQVTHIRLYRTTAGGALLLYDQEVANTTETITSSQADNALGAACATDNDPPPNCGYVSSPYLDRYWLCGNPDFPHYLYYTKRFQPEAVPTANYLELGTPDDPLQCFIPFGGIGIAFAHQRKYRVIGTGTTSFLPHETPGKRGTLTPTSACVGEDGVYFAAKDGIFRTTGFSADEQLAGPILPLFLGESKNGYEPINLADGCRYAIAIWKGRLYFAYPAGNATLPTHLAVHRLGTTQWQIYDYAMESIFYETDTDYLTGGGVDGYLWRLEDGTSDAGVDITWNATSKDYAHSGPGSPGGSLERKIYSFTKDDAEPNGGTISAAFSVDGVLKHTDILEASRRPTQNRLPAGSQGYRWRKAWSGSTTSVQRVYGTTVLATPMSER